MRHALASLLAILLAGTLFLGCDSDNTTGAAGPNPLLNTATITVRHILARIVTANIVSFRLTGFNSSGAQVLAPVTVPKSAQVDLVVPISLTLLRIEYLDGNGTVVGQIEIPVALTAGQTLVIDDPNWLDVGGGNQGGNAGGNAAGGAAGGTGGPVATQLAFMDTLGLGRTNTNLTAFRVAIQDANGATVTTATNPVTLTLATNPGNATLGGTVTVNAVAGIATFDAVQLNQPGAGYSFTATATGLTSATSNTFTVGLGNLAFTPNGPFAVAGGNTGTFSSQGLASADFNRDGRTDAVVVNENNAGEDATVLISTGAAFTQVAINSSVNTPTGVATGDFNGDQNPDFALITNTDLLVYLGNGAATPAFNESTVNFGGARLAAANMDGDQDIDIVAYDNNTGNLRVFTNNGAGTFTHTAFASGQALNVTGMVLGDMNGDNLTDVALTTFNDEGRVWVQPFTNNTTNLVTLPRPGNGSSQDLVIGDFNGDGRRDIVISYNAPDLARMHRNDNNNLTFTIQDFPEGVDVFGSEAGDFDRDSRLDLAVANVFGFVVTSDKADLTILLGNGDATFQNARPFPTATAAQRSRPMTVGDYNGDGKLDAILSYPGEGRAELFLNTST